MNEFDIIDLIDEELKFNYNDEVKVVSDCSSFASMDKAGQTGKIIDIYINVFRFFGYQVEFPDGDRCYCNDFDLEKV